MGDSFQHDNSQRGVQANGRIDKPGNNTDR
jgi:hypothetical protein